MSVDIIDTNNAAKMAWKNDVIPKFGITCANPSKTAPFIIGIIKPKETTASGRVSNRIIGFTNIFIKLLSNLTICFTAVINLIIIN